MKIASTLVSVLILVLGCANGSHLRSESSANLMLPDGIGPHSSTPGTTGILSGQVIDAAEGGGLPGATVIIEGTQLGVATDLDGNYTLVGIPVGTYDVTARFVGYESFTVIDVAIVTGQTTRLDFQLSDDSVQLEGIEVVYERPIIQRDAIGAPRVVSGDHDRPRPNRSRPASTPNPVAIRGRAPQGGVVAYADGYPNTAQNGEGYARIEEIGFQSPLDSPFSTFSIDVDRASYTNVRRMLNDGYLPPPDAVRIEEFVNYFDYEYPGPSEDSRHPFEIHTEVANTPWNAEHQLVRVGLQGRRIATTDLPPANLVFLIDVSGSMSSHDKLPLLVRSFHLLVDELREEDNVTMVVYAGAAGVVLEPTSGDQKRIIRQALNRLQAGGSTAGSQGLQLAYELARRNFNAQGNNRVILATDGDFNVGPSSDDEMIRLIERERTDGIFLSVLGFGTGNLQDSKMEALADHGNGNYSYIDSIREAQRVFVNEFGGTLFTIAKDVKIQIEFNPAHVAAYRLIGYENRMLRDEEFNDDTRDAGELGAGHRVTALYEIVPHGASTAIPIVDSLRYQPNPEREVVLNDELLNVKLRYKPATGDGQFSDESVLLSEQVQYSAGSIQRASESFRFAAAVAEFGLLLRGSEYASDASAERVIALARTVQGEDPNGDRGEFIQLVHSAKSLLDERSASRIGVNSR